MYICRLKIKTKVNLSQYQELIFQLIITEPEVEALIIAD